MEIAGLVLAAGAGRRYGMPKALVSYRGELLVRRAAGALRAAGMTGPLVVIGAEAARVRALAPELTFVDNPAWATGMASSLRAGLAALAGGPAGAAVVLLVDMPGVTPEAVREIAAGATSETLVMGGYAGRRSHPVLLGREHWAGVARSATGDRGARDYLRAHADHVRVVPVGHLADDTDLDVPDPGAPDRGLPDRDAPDQDVPDRGRPDHRLPDRDAPDQDVPDRGRPGHRLPDPGRPEGVGDRA